MIPFLSAMKDVAKALKCSEHCPKWNVFGNNSISEGDTRVTPPTGSSCSIGSCACITHPRAACSQDMPPGVYGRWTGSNWSLHGLTVMLSDKIPFLEYIITIQFSSCLILKSYSITLSGKSWGTRGEVILIKKKNSSSSLLVRTLIQEEAAVHTVNSGSCSSQ